MNNWLIASHFTVRTARAHVCTCVHMRICMYKQRIWFIYRRFQSLRLTCIASNKNKLSENNDLERIFMEESWPNLSITIELIWRKFTKATARMADLATQIWNRNLPNMKQGCYSLHHDVLVYVCMLCMYFVNKCTLQLRTNSCAPAARNEYNPIEPL